MPYRCSDEPPEVFIDLADEADDRLEILDLPSGSTSSWLFDGDALCHRRGQEQEERSREAVDMCGLIDRPAQKRAVTSHLLRPLR